MQRSAGIQNPNMKSFLVLTLLVLILFSAVTNSTLLDYSTAISFAGSSTEQSAFDKREAAYRANNLGVAFLEQYKTKEAVGSFTRALEIKPDLLIARINLSIALYYLPEIDGAKREAGKALSQDQNAPQPHYILGLIARAQNRFEEAAAEFGKVLQIDPTDVGSNINIGQILVQEKKYQEAIGAFRRAIDAEPYNETALYNLGLLLTRTGKKEEGQRLIKKFQQFKESGAGTTLGTNYLEGGHYAEALISTGAEGELVDRDTPKVTFADATSNFLPARAVKATPLIETGPAPNTEYKEEWIRGFSGGVTLFDMDGDGSLDLLDSGPDAPRLYRNTGGKFLDVSETCGALCRPNRGINIGAVAGDYDNDGHADILLLSYRPRALSLYHNDGEGHFSDVTRNAAIPSYSYLSVSASFVDIDHDGDLDIFVAGFIDFDKPAGGNRPGRVQSFPERFAGAPNLLLRNNGNGKFVDITAAAKVTGDGDQAIAVIPTDYDDRRDIDLLVVNYGAPPALYRNLRDGTFRNVAAETRLSTAPKNPDELANSKWRITSAAVGDLNKDGFPDLCFVNEVGTVIFANSDGKGKFTLEDKPWMLPVGTLRNTAAQLIDYDNDGLLDLIELRGDGIHVLRNEGKTWRRIGSPAQERLADNARPLLSVPVRGWHTFASGDIDGDGDVDLLIRSARGDLIVARNNGGNRNHSIAVNLHGRISNRSAIEAKVEMRAGSLYQKLETYSASPAPAPADLIFGLGKREQPDAMRVMWPAGIVQAETEFHAGAGGITRLDITELDRKPSSCPYLYTWNGERFEFITDFMGGGEMGYLEEPGRYNKPDPEEYVRIRGDQLKERNGRYELRVTNELEEAMFVDRLQLLAVTHPIGTEVYPNEGMSDPPKPFQLFVTHDARPPLSAIDNHGHDVLDLISRMDRRWPDDFKVDRIRGYAEEHTLTMSLLAAGSAGVPPATARRSLAEGRKRSMPERQSPSAHQSGRAAKTGNRVPARTEDSKAEGVILLLTGWTDYAWSSDNVAAKQAGKAMKPPSLQVKDAKGNWRTVIEDIGIPVGRPQTVTVDLTGKFMSARREVRIVTNMRIYWDQILADTFDGTVPVQITRVDPSQADLRWRGFSAEITTDGREPFGYDYERVAFTSPWKVMAGRYTREGDVRELLLRSDDMFAICRPGDEIRLSFDASALPPLPKGWTRTFLLYSDGFSKEMDINSASPDQLEPLPFHGMTRYPYSWPEHYPLTEARRRYMEKYNTRLVASPVARY